MVLVVHVQTNKGSRSSLSIPSSIKTLWWKGVYYVEKYVAMYLVVGGCCRPRGIPNPERGGKQRKKEKKKKKKKEKKQNRNEENSLQDR